MRICEPRRRARDVAALGLFRGLVLTLLVAQLERSGDYLRDGLYVALDPWSWYLFDAAHSTLRRTTDADIQLSGDSPRASEDDLFDANPWYEWGPYLSERAWGTVREDYSPDGNAWDSFPHDHARSRVYRWNAAWPVSPTSATTCAWAWRCGTVPTRS